MTVDWEALKEDLLDAPGPLGADHIEQCDDGAFLVRGPQIFDMIFREAVRRTERSELRWMIVATIDDNRDGEPFAVERLADSILDRIDAEGFDIVRRST